MTSYIYNMVDTWNDGATTFTAVKMNVTDTASNAASLLMDLQVGGSSRFNVGKTGSLKLGVSPTGTNQAGTNVIIAGSQGTGTGAGGSIIFQVAPAGSSGTAQNSLVTFLEATSARAFNLYNTTDVTTNFERGKIAWESNVLRIGTEKGGTGTARALEFQTDGVTRMTLSSAGILTVNENFIAASNRVYFGSAGGNGRIQGNSSGVFSLLDGAGTAFNRLQFGGTTSSFPALKRSSTTLQARLADDSDFASVQGKLTTDTAYAAGDPTTTGYLVVYDSTGTAYKIPAVAV